MKKNLFLSLLLLCLFLFSAISSCDIVENNSNNNRPNAPILSNNSVGIDKNFSGETIKVVSWNLYNFGKSKDAGEIEYIAKILKDFDIVAIQEVSTSLYGVRAVGKLADQLNRTGSKWEYKISNPTSGDGKERYAYLWKPTTKQTKISLKKDWLEESIEKQIDREPYMARFEITSKKTKSKNIVLIGNFHAVPISKDPENEIVFLEEIPNTYRRDNILILGDFNLDAKHEAFDGLRERSFIAAFDDQETSLRMKPKNGNPLSEPYDNIFIETRAFITKEADVIHFYKDYKTLKEARYISDHIPVWVEIGFKK